MRNLLLSILLGLLLIVSQSACAELITNGNFESGETGWNKWGPNSRIVSDSPYYKGAASATLYWTDSGWYQTVPVQENDVFKLSGEIIHPTLDQLNGRVAIIKIEFWDNTKFLSTVDIGVLSPLNSPNQWYSFMGYARAPAGSVKAIVVLMTWDLAGENTGTGRVYFDNISLVKPNEPADPDFNNDLKVNSYDLVRFSTSWLTQFTEYDLSGDGLVNFADFADFAEHWESDICQSPGYSLVWSDEFSGSSIDSNNWSHQVMGDGGNQELQYYTDRLDNSWVEDGHLIIQSKREQYHANSTIYNFTSARLRTAGKQSFLYGRIEARIKVPTGRGMWPAFWLMPTDDVYGGWAASGEIDIMETCNNTDYIGGALHYGGEWPLNDSSSGSYFKNGSTDFSQEFHVYSIEWEPTEIRWYVDRILYLVRNSWWSSGGSYPAPFDQNFYIILNTAVGGTYTGAYSPQDVTATFPQQMKIDWVRVYRKTE